MTDTPPTSRVLVTDPLMVGVPLQLPQVGAGWVHDKVAELARRLTDAAAERTRAWLGPASGRLADAGTWSYVDVLSDARPWTELASPAGSTVDDVLRRWCDGEDAASILARDPEGEVAAVPDACWRSEFPRTSEVRWLDPAALAVFLADGWQVHLANADWFDTALAERCADLGWLTTDIVQADLVLTADGPLDLGTDRFDRLVVLAAGEAEVVGGEAPSVMVGAADVVLVPRSQRVRLVGDELRAALVFRLSRLVARSLFERIAHEAGHWPLLRADVPFHLDQVPQSYERSVFDHDGALATELGTVAGPDLVERAVAVRRARLRRPAPASLGTTIDALNGVDGNTFVHLPLSAPPMLGGADGQAVLLAFENQLVRLRVEALDALCAMAIAPSPVASLPDVVIDGVDRRVQLVREGLRAGILRLISTDLEGPGPSQSARPA